MIMMMIIIIIIIITTIIKTVLGARPIPFIYVVL